MRYLFQRPEEGSWKIISTTRINLARKGKDPVEEALEKMPLPVRSCTCDVGTGKGYCRCVYVPVV
jgi:hypothetical protein